MNEFQESEQRYLRMAERRARAKGMTTAEYLGKKTTLLTEELLNTSPKPSTPHAPIKDINRMEDIARQSSKPVQEPRPLPAGCAVIEVNVREPRGEFYFEMEVPQIGDLIVASERNSRGYKSMMVEALLYRLYGVIRE